jgi:hypothetical protein
MLHRARTLQPRGFLRAVLCDAEVESAHASVGIAQCNELPTVDLRRTVRTESVLTLDVCRCLI